MTPISLVHPIPAQKGKLSSIFLICFVSFVWALMELVVQTIARQHSLYQVIWTRYATHMAFILLIFGPRHGLSFIRTKHLKLQLLRASMMLVMPFSFIIGVRYLGARNILAIFWLSPLLMLGLSMKLLCEKVGHRLWLTATAGYMAIVLLLHPNRNMTIIGSGLALAMGLSFSLYLVMTRMLRHESTVTNLFYTAFGVLAPLSIGLPWFWQRPTVVTGSMMTAVGLLGLLLLYALDKALEISAVTRLAPFLYTQPIWMFLLSYLLRHILHGST